MKKYVLVVLASIVSSFGAAQLTEYPSSLDQSGAIAAPPSNIEFLKRSLESSDVSGVVTPVEKMTPPAKSKPTASTSSKTETAKNSEPSQNTKVAQTETSQPAKSAASQPMPIETEVPVAENQKTAQNAEEEAELDYAARMLQQAKKNANQGRFIPQTPSQTGYVPAATTKGKPFNPNDYRPGVEWQKTNSTHFIIYTQKRDGGIGSSNMSMAFESAYATLRRNIPWMMSDKVRVFVYQDHTNYLKYEPNAKAWTRALAYPTRGEIVVYDEPGKQQELKEVFTHELVHIFTQKFFDKYQTGRIMTPNWLDEGLAVYMEDQAYNGSKGGPWSKDLKTLNIRRNPQTASVGRTNSGAANLTRKGPPVVFMPFDEFMKASSLSTMEARGRTQDWYLQAYAMVQFLLNPSWGLSPSNRMQFQQFTALIAQGEPLRDPATGFAVKGANGKPMYRPFSAEKAMGRAYRYNSTSNFEDAFFRWLSAQR